MIAALVPARLRRYPSLHLSRRQPFRPRSEVVRTDESRSSPLSPGVRVGPYRILGSLGPAGWERSSGRGTRASAGTWRSRSCRRRSPRTRPPGPQARGRLPHARRAGQNPRLRPRAGRRVRPRPRGREPSDSEGDDIARMLLGGCHRCSGFGCPSAFSFFLHFPLDKFGGPTRAASRIGSRRLVYTTQPGEACRNRLSPSFESSPSHCARPARSQEVARALRILSACKPCTR